MKFTIERSKWLRGGEQDNFLFYKGKMCCLGFVSNQCGVGRAKMSHVGPPADLDEKSKRKVPFLIHDQYRLVDSLFSQEAIAINDDGSISEKEREFKLKALFKEHGHEIRFTD